MRLLEVAIEDDHKELIDTFYEDHRSTDDSLFETFKEYLV